MISLILPTFRRPHLLRGALASIAASEGCARSGVEVVVVDNNSRDTTPAVVSAAAGAYPFELRYVLEERQGVSHARNSGAQRAAGDHFVFMDDDQQIDRAYLARIPASFAETGADCVGGWTGYIGVDGFPGWLRTVVGRVGQRDFGPHLRRIGVSDPRLQGGNIAIARAIFERIGGYRTDVGPCGDRTTYGEDTEIQDRIVACGGTIFYDPQLRQNHYLEPERMKRGYYLRRAFQAGRGDYRLHKQELRNVPHLLGAPRFLWRRAGAAAVGVAASVGTAPGERFDRFCRLASELGQIHEALHAPAASPSNVPKPGNS
ncbi:MAG: glycosyltransferase family 2 protein [Rhodospirillaceae bacterium]